MIGVLLLVATSLYWYTYFSMVRNTDNGGRLDADEAHAQASFAPIPPAHRFGDREGVQRKLAADARAAAARDVTASRRASATIRAAATRATAASERSVERSASASAAADRQRQRAEAKHATGSVQPIRCATLDRCPDERFSFPNALSWTRASQLVLLRMLRIFQLLCAEAGVPFWLAAGTMRGAFTHRGFVPWDTDVDLMMFEEDFARWKAHASTDRLSLLGISLEPEQPWLEVMAPGPSSAASAELLHMPWE